MPMSIFVAMNKQTTFPFMQRNLESKLERHRRIDTSNLQGVDIKWHESVGFQVSRLLHVCAHLSLILRILINLLG